MSNDPQYIEEVQEQPDQWHTHAAAEGAPQTEHGAQANPLFLAGILSALVVSTLVLSILVVVYFNSYVTKVKAEKMERPVGYEQFAVSKAEMLGAGGRLNTFGIIDVNTRTVRIPIELAMDKVVAEYSEND